MDVQRWLKRVDELLTKGSAAQSSIRQDTGGFGFRFSDSGLLMEFRAASLSFLRQVYGESHPFFVAFKEHPETSGIEYCVGVLKGVKDEMQGGWYESMRGLLAAELFTDFLEMAAHLLDEGYKDAAAIIVGSTLEGHLRQLAIKNKLDTESVRNGVPVPKKAEMLNGELSKVAYEKQDNKNVTSWLNLRNDAAHGHYDKYQIEQVRIMLAGVRDFMTRVSA